ncbi:hypothetical protein ACKWTF_014802 [Chironomus riparius]
MKYLSWIVVVVLLAGCDQIFGQNQTEVVQNTNGTAGNVSLESFTLNLVVINSTVSSSVAPLINTNVTENPTNASAVTTTSLPINASDITTPVPSQFTNTTDIPTPAPSNSTSNDTTPLVPSQNSTIPANSTEKASIFPPEYTPATGWGTFLIAFGLVVIAGLVLSAFYFKSKKRGSRNEFSPLLSELESDM